MCLNIFGVFLWPQFKAQEGEDDSTLVAAGWPIISTPELLSPTSALLQWLVLLIARHFTFTLSIFQLID